LFLRGGPEHGGKARPLGSTAQGSDARHLARANERGGGRPDGANAGGAKSRPPPDAAQNLPGPQKQRQQDRRAKAADGPPTERRSARQGAARPEGPKPARRHPTARRAAARPEAASVGWRGGSLYAGYGALCPILAARRPMQAPGPTFQRLCSIT